MGGTRRMLHLLVGLYYVVRSTRTSVSVAAFSERTKAVKRWPQDAVCLHTGHWSMAGLWVGVTETCQCKLDPGDWGQSPSKLFLDRTFVAYLVCTQVTQQQCCIKRILEIVTFLPVFTGPSEYCVSKINRFSCAQSYRHSYPSKEKLNFNVSVFICTVHSRSPASFNRSQGGHQEQLDNCKGTKIIAKKNISLSNQKSRIAIQPGRGSSQSLLCFLGKK